MEVTNMKTTIVGIGFLILFMVLAAFWFTPAQAADKFDYVGAKKCAMCHRNVAKGGQFQQWEKSPHAKAYATLLGDKAKAIAAERKLAKPANESPECLKCHVTAFPVMANLATAKITLEEGVSCESCHGPGSAYSPISVMKDVTAGTKEPKSVGLTLPDAAVCQRCHNKESPTFDGFKFEEMAAKIAHPDPTLKKAEKAAPAAPATPAPK
jgi:nitrate/TMAO reductase-like tetraheme cytochrome c subunit